MTELLVTPKSVAHISTLIDKGADAFVIGEQKFGLRLAGEFNRTDMEEAVKLIHKHGKSICRSKWYLSQLPLKRIRIIHSILHEIQVDRIIFGDPAVVMYVKAQQNPIPLNWDAEALVTNHFQCNYWGKRVLNVHSLREN